MKRLFLGIAALTLLLATTETASAQWGYGGSGFGVSYGTRVGNRGFLSVGYGTGYSYPAYGYSYAAPVYGYSYAAPVYDYSYAPVYSTPVYGYSYAPVYYSSPSIGVSYYRGGWGRGWGVGYGWGW
jgi:hypothetical protein